MIGWFSLAAALLVLGGIVFALWRVSPWLAGVTGVAYYADDPSIGERLGAVVLAILVAIGGLGVVTLIVAALASLIQAMALRP